MDEAAADLMVLDELRKKSKIMTKSKSRACATECGCCKPGEKLFQSEVHKAPSVLVLTVAQLDGSSHKIESLSPDDLMEDLYRTISEVLQIPAPNLSLVLGTTALQNFSGQTLRSVGLTSQASVMAIRSNVPYLSYSDAAVAELLKDMDEEIDAAMRFSPEPRCCGGRICNCEPEWVEGPCHCGCCSYQVCECDDSEFGCWYGQPWRICRRCFCARDPCCPCDRDPDSESISLSDCRLMCKDRRASVWYIGRKKNKPRAASHSNVDRMDRKTTAKQRRIRFRHGERLCCTAKWDAERCNEMKMRKRQMSKCNRHMDKQKHYRLAFMQLEAELEDNDTV
jgi:hypothetical protein